MNPKLPCRPGALRTLAMFSTLSTAALSSHALTIVPVFDGSVTAPFQAAVNDVIAEYEALFTDPITVTIDVQASSSCGLGCSSTNLTGTYSYAQVRTALINDEAAHPSASGATSVGPGGSINTTTDPTGGGSFWLSTAQAKALGLMANNTSVDGTFSYSSSVTWTTDPSNRGSGGFDFIGVAEHEISEIMGRITLNGSTLSSVTNSYTPYDLFSFTAAGAHSFSTGGGRYFSIDNGTTNLHGYNNALTNGGDPQDWDASAPGDSYNAFTTANQAHSISAADVAALDVIGWDLVTAVPEPGTWALMFAGIAAIGSLVRRRSPS